jgi:penicillin-binding protein 2
LVARDMGVDLIHDQLKPLGFGQYTGIDILGESRGILPSTEWKRRAYKKPEQQRWYSGETISLGIGQGYNSYTMLQLAQATATLVNQGTQMRPHLVREVIDPVTAESRVIAKSPVAQLSFKPEHLATIRQAMVDVNLYGTSAASFVGASYTSGGKTGTAQVYTVRQNEKYNASRVDERLRDHALFIAYAPAEEPKVALAMVVENAGFGAQNAAPIARRVFDYLVNGTTPSKEDIAAVQRGQATRPLGEARAAPQLASDPR